MRDTQLLAAVIGFVLVALLLPMPSYAVQPDEVLKDEKLENRARKLSLELRCLVCQNQSIDDSNAPLAKDLRVLVRERLTAGDTDKQVIDYIVARYGEFVLLRPRFGLHTLLLWLSPLLLLLIGAFLSWKVLNSYQKQDSKQTNELTDEEKEKFKKLIDEAST